MYICIKVISDNIQIRRYLHEKNSKYILTLLLRKTYTPLKNRHLDTKSVYKCPRKINTHYQIQKACTYIYI